MDRAAAIELIRGLVAIPSLSRQEAAASAWLAGQMREMGYERAFVDEGPTAKRFMPRAHGRATPIFKRTSHITVIVDERRPGGEA